MPSGLAIPIRAIAGRLAVDTGEDQMRKILMLALGEDASLHPFVRRGITSPVFHTDTPAARAVLRSEIETHFRRFEREHRAKLLSLQFDKTSASGVTTVTVSYMDLRVDRQHELQLTLGDENG